MKISEKQAHMLLVILQDSQKNISGLFSYDLDARNRLLNDIINQQSDKLKEVDDIEQHQQSVEDRNKYGTDALFNALPSFINIKGDLYHFGLSKGINGIKCWYKMNDIDGGKYLADTSRGGKTLNAALHSMLNWLIEFDYYDVKSDNILADMIRSSFTTDNI